MRHWTAEERRKQSELIRNWQPWKAATPKTDKAKAASRRNAFKHGNYSAEIKAMRAMIAECRKLLKSLGEIK